MGKKPIRQKRTSASVSRTVIVVTNIHIVSGNVINDVLPKILSKFACNHIICLGKPEESIQFPNFTIVEWSNSDESDLLLQIQTLIDNITDSTPDPHYSRYYVCLDSRSNTHSLMLFLIAMALNGQSYLISESDYSIPKILLRKPDVQEVQFLRALSKLGGIVDTYGDIAEECGWGKRESSKGIGRVSYIAKKLERQGIIRTSKKGSGIMVEFTPDGRLYMLINI